MIEPDLKARVIELLDAHNADLALCRSIHQMPPSEDASGELWEEHRTGSLYIVIRVGAVEQDVETNLRLAFGHDLMSANRRRE